MSKKDLGDLVDVNSLPTDSLLENTIFESSEDSTTPFVMKDENTDKKINTDYEPKQVKKQAKLTVEDVNDIDDIDDFEDVIKKPKKRSQKKSISDKKATTQLKKFRELFGIKRIDVKYHQIKRKDTLGNVVTITCGFRALNYEDWQWLLEKVADIENIDLDTIEKTSVTNVTNYKLALIAISLCTLDTDILEANSQGTPIWKVMGIKPNNADHVKDPYFPHVFIRHSAADLLFQEVKNTLFDVIDDLVNAYNDLIDSNLNDYLVDQKEEEDNPLA